MEQLLLRLSPPVRPTVPSAGAEAWSLGTQQEHGKGMLMGRVFLQRNPNYSGGASGRVRKCWKESTDPQAEPLSKPPCLKADTQRSQFSVALSSGHLTEKSTEIRGLAGIKIISFVGFSVMTRPRNCHKNFPKGREVSKTFRSKCRIPPET